MKTPSHKFKDLTQLLCILCFCLYHTSSFATDLHWTGCGISKKAFIHEISNEYKKLTGITIKITGGGATKGIRNTASNQADIGGSCRHILPHPEEKNLQMHHVAWDALVIVTHPRNKVKTLSPNEIRAIFLGQVTNWKQVGGRDAKIEVLTREGAISGVGLSARELLFSNPHIQFKSSKEFSSTGPLESALEKMPNGIAFDGISSAKKRNLTILKINNISPTIANICSGKYLLFRPLYLVTQKKTEKKVRDFIHFVK
ncbi:MAG: substrate-binding domain-containing protein, partial [Flavobacteriaceae bacterium]|nr:substrate-binding domain-containing protein [Flavobacteriaceae bacterium]